MLKGDMRLCGLAEVEARLGRQGAPSSAVLRRRSTPPRRGTTSPRSVGDARPHDAADGRRGGLARMPFEMDAWRVDGEPGSQKGR